LNLFFIAQVEDDLRIDEGLRVEIETDIPQPKSNPEEETTGDDEDANRLSHIMMGS
jgi:hypothetical protein